MSIFSIGLSGLDAAQNALNTTSNNISNVNTPGYNRELTLLSEGNVSGGVAVADIERQFNQYVATQLNAATSESQALKSYETQVSQIDNLLADGEAGLAPLMQNFFASLGDLAGAPSDPAARQGVLGSADTLSAQFRSFDGYLQDMQEGINTQIENEVTQINNATQQLSGLNREIALAKAKQGEAPNSLLNQRDQLVTELSERLDATLNIQDGGTYNVTLENGQPLVAGTRHFQLEAIDSAADPQRTVIGYQDAAGNRIELGEGTISGGALGGLMSFRRETLDGAQNQLGHMAIALAEGFNAQHAEGVDLDGNPGEALFSIGEPRGYAHTDNAGSAEVSEVAIASLDSLRPTDYRIHVDPEGANTLNGLKVVRQDTGEVLTPGDEVRYDGATRTLRFDGLAVRFSEGAMAEGDRFEVQAVRRGAGGIETRLRDLDRLAAGQGEYAGAGDNRNALALQDLQSESLVGGTATLNQAYASMVSDMGNRTNIVKVNLEAQQGLTDQLQAVQQSESGVNLDEEAANLIRYQEFYQANAKVIEIGSSLLDTILRLRA
ncbi:flagellar hook-associated protein FlgK [Halomonas sp. YLGW01]|uniref:flagellar hook-associated protein FlgK n=1 Tax=Halomonas sp. YLGW01 TaxID=2773308 RepID=UPI001783051A|nr:flagellar hook-associated protein FlgK [Halomonas sp. YLGW01]